MYDRLRQVAAPFQLVTQLIDHRAGSHGARAILYIEGALTRLEPICYAYVVFIITKL